MKPKTLKDIESDVYITEVENPIKGDDCISFMGKAKVSECNWENFCATGENKLFTPDILKTEAIKHIKDLREEKVDCIKYRFANDFAANYLMFFFNITEQDVLEGKS